LTASASALSVCQKIRAVNPFFCALLLRSLTGNRLNWFYNRLNRFSFSWPAVASPISLPFLPSLLLSSFFPANAAYTFSLSLSFTHHSKTHLCHPIFGSFVGDPFISASSIFSLDLVGISVIQTSDRGIALFYFFLLDLTRSWLSSVSFVGDILV
jgi:hypothetical protein